ncbi:hypothetical protein ACQ4PT_010666 [Festuca glaucescens]
MNRTAGAEPRGLTRPRDFVWPRGSSPQSKPPVASASPSSPCDKYPAPSGLGSCSCVFSRRGVHEGKMNCPSSASSCCGVSPPVLANPRGEFAASCSTRTSQKAHFFGSRQFPRVIHSPANRASSSLSWREVIAFAGQQSWDIGRFAKTLFFFNGPPNPLKIVESIMSTITGSAPTEAPKKMETSDVVLVTGATGGVGRRVVDVLRKKGLPVRVLVRNEEKARKMLGPDVDLIIGDVTKGDTLDPKYFKGIKKVINAVSVIVGPKEGDTPDRQKYSQGINFLNPR